MLTDQSVQGRVVEGDEIDTLDVRLQSRQCLLYLVNIDGLLELVCHLV